jgi:hypothetical protein
MIENLLIGILGVLGYGSGFLVWPVCAFLWRKKRRQARLLRWFFFGELAAQLTVAGFFVFSRGILEHQYYWCVVSMLANIVFTPFMILAALYDLGKQAPAA